jgi:hypothetical protein
LSPRTLQVTPIYRRRRIWPWVVAAAVLLALGVWEVQSQRRRAVPVAGVPAPSGEVRGAPISGLVLGPEGRPAGGVTVVATEVGAEARSADDGRFQLEVEAGTTVQLEAHHSDLGFASAMVRAPATDVQLRLAARAGLEVHVLSGGRPVSGADISVHQRSGDLRLFHADRTTDANGTLRFVGLPGGPMEVEAVLPGTGARALRLVGAVEGSVAQITLELPAARTAR